jgi:hypothetical protein
LPSNRTIAAFAIIVIIILGLLISGVIPGFKLPRSSSLISISQVNLSQGGQAQGQYLVNTYWDVVYQVNSPQTAVLVLDGSCASSNCASTSLAGQFNGATVNATSQLYVTISPGQPIAWETLSSQNVNWAQPASGLECENPFGIYNNCSVNVGAQGPLSVYTSGTGAVWHYYFPVTITVEKIGGKDPFQSISKTIDAFSQSSVTMSNPNDPSENLTINGLGVNIGKEGLPDPSVTAFQVSGSWVILGGYDVSGISQGYNTYWYNGQQQFQTIGGESAPDQRYNSPGWEQLQEAFHEECLFGHCLVNTNSYYYAPIAPSITNSPTGSSTSQSYPLPSPVPGTSSSVTVTATTHGGLGLESWLEQNYGTFSPYYDTPYDGRMWINSTSLQIDLPTSVFTPSVQLLVSTQLVDTIINQQNNAQFKISNVVSTPSSIYDGETAQVTMDVTDTSSFGGTAIISSSGNNTAFGIEPSSQNVTLGAGQSKPVSFTVKASGVQQKVSEQLTFEAINGADQITDTKSLSIEALPIPLNSSFFTVESICPTSSACSQTSPIVNITSGAQTTVFVTIFNAGNQGAAFISSSSGQTSFATIAPSSVNQTIGSDSSITVPFYITGVSTGSSAMKISVSNSTAFNDIQLFFVSVNNAPIGCETNCGPPPGGIPLILWIGIALIVVALVAGGVYYFKRR